MRAGRKKATAKCPEYRAVNSEGSWAIAGRRVGETPEPAAEPDELFGTGLEL